MKMRLVLALGASIVPLAGASTGGPSATVAPAGQEAAAPAESGTDHSLEIKPGQLVTDETWQRLKKPLDAAAAAQIALLNNPDLQALLEKDGISRADLGQAGLLDIPAGTIADPPSPHADPAKAPDAPSPVTHEVIEHIAEVKEAFYTFQAVLQLEAELKPILAADQAAVDLEQKQPSSGNPGQIGTLDLQAEAASVQMAFFDVHKQRIAAREKLNRLMGLSMAAIVWAAEPQLPPIPDHDTGTAELEFVALAQRRDLQALRAETDKVSRKIALKPSPKLNAEHRRLERRMQALAVEIGSAVREDGRTLFVDRKEAEFLGKTLVPLTIAMVNQTTVRARGSPDSGGDLVRARQRELEAQQQYIEAWRDYWIARAKLEADVGGNLSPKNAPP